MINHSGQQIYFHFRFKSSMKFISLFLQIFLAPLLIQKQQGLLILGYLNTRRISDL